MNLYCTSNPFFLIPEITCFFINKATTLRNKRVEKCAGKSGKKVSYRRLIDAICIILRNGVPQS
jgi:hypothetical protein